MKKAIAVDFDGCLCINDYPRIGAPNWAVIKRALEEQIAGAGLILFTCREDELLEEAIAAAASWGIRFDAINESLPDWRAAWGNDPRKPGATEYWDDRALRADFFGVQEPRVHSHWESWDTTAFVGLDGDGEPKYAPRRFFRCGRCRYGSVVKTKFCPDCGADLREVAGT